MGHSLAPYFTLEGIRAYAAEYLTMAHPSGEIPIPIDEIVERHHKIEIVPYPMLRDKRGVDGFVSRDAKSIYVDNDIIKARNPFKFRFTIAHELAHVILHQRVFKSAKFVDVGGWIGYVSSITGLDAKYIEGQAYKMAGYLLVPHKDFEAAYADAAKKLEKTGLDIRALTPEGLKHVASKIGEPFQVSWDVIRWQGVYAKVWEPDDFPVS